jgi:hypothetical protein
VDETKLKELAAAKKKLVSKVASGGAQDGWPYPQVESVSILTATI